MKTSQLSTTIVLVCLITLLLSNAFITRIQCQPNTAVDTYDCSPATYDPASGYGQEVEEGMSELIYYTCDQPQYQYTLTGTYAVGFAYCQVNLTPTDCVTCLESASDFLKSDCSDAVYAYVALVDCGMRYGPINNGPSAA